jgi:hypothetical protein
MTTGRRWDTPLPVPKSEAEFTCPVKIAPVPPFRTASEEEVAALKPLCRRCPRAEGDHEAGTSSTRSQTPVGLVPFTVLKRQNRGMSSDTGASDADTPPPPSAVPPGPLAPEQRGSERPAWTLLTNHGHVLLAVAESQDARVADIAARVGITPRATLAILKDLEDAAYLTRRRVGRRSHYTVDAHQHFRHPATAAHEVGELLAIFADPSRP